MLQLSAQIMLFESWQSNLQVDLYASFYVLSEFPTHAIMQQSILCYAVVTDGVFKTKCKNGTFQFKSSTSLSIAGKLKAKGSLWCKISVILCEYQYCIELYRLNREKTLTWTVIKTNEPTLNKQNNTHATQKIPPKLTKITTVIQTQSYYQLLVTWEFVHQAHMHWADG